MVIAGLFAVLFLVLILPFAIHIIEENLEIFLFVMGIAACVIAGHLSWELVLEALHEPIMIALAVLIAGLLFLALQDRFEHFMKKVLTVVPLWLVVFFTIVVLGLLSSVITAIIASLILVEIIFILPLQRKDKIVVCIIACFSIGLGAAMTPIGEPLSTIAISRLNQDFFYLVRLLGKYIIPAVIVFGVIGAFYTAWGNRSRKTVGLGPAAPISGAERSGEESAVDLPAEEPGMAADNWRGIVFRAFKVYLFVMALVFLGQGFQVIVDIYILSLNYRLLYWVNMVSAVLDNATLTAAEISPMMSTMQIEAILMGLMISGGMLIPGNIPNIISASKLKITSTEWAKIGVPMGLLVMVLFYFIMF